MMNESAGKIIPWSSILDGYTGVITKTRLYYFNYEGKLGGGIPQDVCRSIWVGVKELIAAKHGIRGEQLPLYLGEIIWRINFKIYKATFQKKRILSQIQDWQYKIKVKSSIPDNRLP
jgi:hypothetical protein